MSETVMTVGDQNARIGEQAKAAHDAYQRVLNADNPEDMLRASFELMTQQNMLTIMTESTSKKRKAELDGQKAAFQAVG